MEELTFSLPSIKAASFLPFLFIQIILLHKQFNSTSILNRTLRLISGSIALWLSLTTPMIDRIEPAKYAIGGNFRYSILFFYAAMKAIEFALVVDTSCYTWIGFNGDVTTEVNYRVEGKEVEKDGVITRRQTRSNELKRRIPTISTHLPSPSPSPSPSPTPSPPLELSNNSTLTPAQGIPISTAHDLLKQSPSLRTYTWTEIFLDSFHLLTSMRGIGYSFGPPLATMAPSPPKSHLEFAKNALKEILKAHISSTLCLLVIIHQRTLVPNLLSTFLPFLPPSSIQPLADILAYTSVGISLYAQMNLGFTGFSLLHLLSTLLLKNVLPDSSKLKSKLTNFNSEEWLPLFNSPFTSKNPSCTSFWSIRWHSFFRQNFLTFYSPTVKILKPILGKQISKVVGTYVVFFLSSYMHSWAMSSAGVGLGDDIVNLNMLSYSERFGGHIYFATQATAVILEGIFTKFTGKKVENLGLIGKVWTYGITIGVGLLAGRSWIALGLVKGLPTIEHWGWQRFILPTIALAPPPVYIV